MKSCSNCGHTIIFGGHQVGDNFLCSKKCEAEFIPSGKEFCESCLVETVEIAKLRWRAFLFVAASKVYNGLSRKNIRFRSGLEFGPLNKNKCPRCGSVIAKLWICFLIPIIPLDRYRILYRKNALSRGAGDIEVRKLRI